MAKKQTRRAISINRKIYDHVKAFCESIGTPMSRLTEQALHDRLTMHEDEETPRRFRRRPHHVKCTATGKEHVFCPIP